MNNKISDFFDSYNESESYECIIKRVKRFQKAEIFGWVESVLKKIPKNEKLIALILSYLFEDSNEYEKIFCLFIEKP
jgi:hypothetical protein